MENQFLITDNIEAQKYNLYMTFHLGDRLYAAPAKSIIEVIKLPLLSIPEFLPDHIVGILNLRGNIINILDISNLIGLPEAVHSLEDCILVLSHNNITWGLIVNAVNNVANISSDQISSTPYGIKDSNTIINKVAKTNDGLLNILNLDFISKIMEVSIDNIHYDEIKEINDFLNKPKFSEKDVSIFASDNKSLEIFQRRARELQRELSLSLERETTTDQRFVSFLLNNEMYAISLKNIREFSKILNLSIVPCVPEFYMGLSNLRGEFIPVVDIKGFLGISKTEITDKTKIIFVRNSNMQLGVIVDDVFDIITVASEKINKSSGMQVEKNKYIIGEIIIDEKTIINIFEVDKFLQDERLIIEEAI